MIVIVGAGLSGLATAYSIVEQAKAKGLMLPPLRILEAKDRVGGKIQTINDGGFICESGPNGWLDKEETTRALINTLDAKDELLPASDAFKNRYIYRNGTLNAVAMNPAKFLSSPLLPWRSKLRLALEPFIEKRISHDDESVAHFATRRIGEDAFKILIDAMQSGIYAGNPYKMSVQSCFPRIVEIEQTYGSLIGGMISLMLERKSLKNSAGGPTGHLTSFNNGLSPLIENIKSYLMKECGPEVIVKNAPVSAIDHGIAPQKARYRIFTSDNRFYDAKELIFALPAYAAAKLIKPHHRVLAEELDQIPYAPLMVVSLGYDRKQVGHPLDGFGFLAPRSEGLRLLGALFSSSIFLGRAPKDHILLRAMIGGAQDYPIAELTNDEILKIVTKELSSILDIKGVPVLARIFRHEKAIPQYWVGHSERLKRIEKELDKLPGLTLTGNAFLGVGINDCIKNAQPIAEKILNIR